jgi:hypothetical protein
LTSLNLADNSFGEMVEGLLPDGWKSKDDDDSAPWLRIEDGHEQDEHPNAKPEGIIAILNAIKDMRDLSSLIFGGDTYSGGESTGWKDVTPVPATLDVGMTEADFSNKNLGPGGATIISAWISHKDNGALSKLDVRDNRIPPTEEALLQGACGAKGISLRLCGGD